ncbi:hypothetical protein [Mycobacterium sp. URHB0044]|jgi:hypothetical protein|uniref:hypothetical protein n=1 Tax=Mycobacterium sp. URHB0044 TaxID=1380386 RepID=UPI00048D7A2F|nr:hypothetical protein [Mycobacterium sp. URHB0044]
MTTIAVAGAVGWLLIIGVGLRFGAAAKRGDEIAKAMRRNRELRDGYGQVISLDRHRNAQRPGEVHRATAMPSLTRISRIASNS